MLKQMSVHSQGTPPSPTHHPLRQRTQTAYALFTSNSRLEENDITLVDPSAFGLLPEMDALCVQRTDSGVVICPARLLSRCGLTLCFLCHSNLRANPIISLGVETFNGLPKLDFL